jgi:SAM-dependent methyltransferase
MAEQPAGEHADSLDAIRAAYAGYAVDDRYRLWTMANRGFARISADRERSLTQLLDRSTPSDGAASILDVGCGTGGTGAVVQRHLPKARYVGVDLIPGFIEEARAANPDLHFEVASAHRLPFQTGGFDIVLALTMFSSLWSSELEQAAAAEIRRVLRPGGWLIWYDLRYPNPSNRAVHGLGRRQVQALFPGWKGDLWSMTVLPPIARRLGATTPLLYPMLEAIPALRSHLIGRLQRPAD